MTRRLCMLRAPVHPLLKQGSIHDTFETSQLPVAPHGLPVMLHVPPNGWIVESSGLQAGK